MNPNDMKENLKKIRTWEVKNLEERTKGDIKSSFIVHPL